MWGYATEGGIYSVYGEIFALFYRSPPLDLIVSGQINTVLSI